MSVLKRDSGALLIMAHFRHFFCWMAPMASPPRIRASTQDFAHSLALRHNERANFAWFSKDNIRAVAHHSGRDQSRRILSRAIATGVRLQSPVPFPKLVCLAVRSRGCVSVLAVGDCLHAV